MLKITGIYIIIRLSILQPHIYYRHKYYLHAIRKYVSYNIILIPLHIYTYTYTCTYRDESALSYAVNLGHTKSSDLLLTYGAGDYYEENEENQTRYPELLQVIRDYTIATENLRILK